MKKAYVILVFSLASFAAGADGLAQKLSQFEKICLKERTLLAHQYANIEQDPAAACGCMVRALQEKHEIELVQTALDEYSSENGPVRSEQALAFVGKVEENCVVDANWRLGTYEPNNFDDRLDNLLRGKKSK